MEEELTPSKLVSFTFEGKEQKVTFVETMKVTDGVECDVYKFDGDDSKDLGIIRIAPGKKTPLQRVLKGGRTVEGFISGNGKLTIADKTGVSIDYPIDDEEKRKLQIDVKIDEKMQWQAAPIDGLVVFEICFPPYENGRYEDIKE